MKKIFRFFFFVLLIFISSESLSAQTSEETEIFYKVDIQPEFPGGFPELLNFVSQNISYPEDAKNGNISGTVYVEFVIDTSGEVLDESIKIKKSIFPSIDEEAIRVVRLLPKWKPGFSSELNKNAKVQMSIPIRFEVPVNNNKPSKTNNKK